MRRFRSSRRACSWLATTSSVIVGKEGLSMVLWGRWLAASLLSRPSAGTCGGRGALSVAVAARCQELVFEFRNFFEFRFFFPTSCQEVFQHEIQQAAAGCRVSAGLLALWSSKKEMVPLLVPNEVCSCIHLKCLRILYWVLGVSHDILDGKRHVFLFPPRILHGFVHPGKILRHLRWMQEQTSYIMTCEITAVFLFLRTVLLSVAI